MQRGEVWTMCDRAYASKARPVVVVQDERYDAFDSVVLCLFTTYDSSDIPTRVAIEPSPTNGLDRLSYVMTDKVVIVDKGMLGNRIGRLSEDDLARISEQLRRILGL